MSIRPAPRQSHLTLSLSIVLHAFTHAYTVLLVPLYLMMQQDLRLPGVNSAALIVTIYLLVSTALSFPAGILADRLNRKWLLGVGLIGNAVAILLMGLEHDYAMLLALGAVAGLFGTLFHPSANSLVPEHYPKSPGMAIGLLAMGAGLGFFFGPQYAGWRAQTAKWELPGLHVANWQHPCIEMGLAGVIVGVLFLMLAHEARGSKNRRAAGHADASRPEAHPPMGILRWKVTALGCVLGCRDFASVGLLTLASIYLQKAYDMGTTRVGFILGVMMLTGVVANPMAVWLSGGRRRLWVLSGCLIGSGLLLASIPHWSPAWVLPVLCVYAALQLGGYAVSDAATYERVPAILRGRVAGLYLSIAGTLAATSPWLLGTWIDALGERGLHAHGYLLPFGVLGAIMALATCAMPILASLGPVQDGVHPPPVPSEVMA